MKKVLLSSAIVLALFTACTSEEKKEEAKEEPTKLENKIADVKDDMVSKANALKEEITAKTDVVKEKAQELQKEVEKKVETITKQVEVAAKKPVINPQSLYVSCSACHGQNGEKQALGKSQIIKGWDADKIEAALNGYKDGSYGGAMKGVMKGQVASKTSEEIKALAKYISEF